MTRFFLCIIALVLSHGLIAFGQSAPLAIQDFADRPSAEKVSLSPDGTKIAFVRNQGTEQFLVIQSILDGEVLRATELRDVKPRRVDFATNNHVLITMSVFKAKDAIVGKGELSRVVSYSLATGKSIQLFERIQEVKFQDKLFSLTNVVGLDKNGEDIYMAAYGAGSSGTYDIFKINLNTGLGDPVQFGARNVRDYFVNPEGVPILRWSYSNVQNTYSLDAWQDGKWVSRLAQSDKGLPTGIFGVSADGSKAYTMFSNDKWGELYEIELEAERNSPMSPVLTAPNTQTDFVVRDGTGIVLGVRYGGLLPSYSFFDDTLTSEVAEFQNRFAGAPVSLIDWSADTDKLLYKIELALGPSVYVLQTRSTGQVVRVADGHPAIAASALGKPAPFYYNARDGQKIPAVLTMPAGGMGSDPRPLVLMPHGGPESFDSVGYDWIAQVFANRGYLVLQPNFRGSDGFGRDHRDQGRGDWRGIMQTDVIDGIEALANMGMIDRNKVCVVGASYGGYSALALATFYPGTVQCAVAIAPVSDLPRMLNREQAVSGRASWVMEYWTRVMGDWRKEQAKLEASSPARFAENVDAPILLIHGDEDIVVPYGQSKLMRDRLEKAGKPVELMKIRQGDHWLSTTRERREVLAAAVEFVEREMPAN
ncbi:MAG: alpha/beta fold hydrolase [Henriciella sp.]|jgi:dipeptidyl aminopeptidase/acylaminoacyl peptidase